MIVECEFLINLTMMKVIPVGSTSPFTRRAVKFLIKDSWRQKRAARVGNDYEIQNK